ncbi:hypothetical protein [Burkholderia sp. lig30]|jgi:hypothetical protein|uniref:hypothetical protein n=1 Tax=Burkholderia sp. lig30 TaxID=1192124 RepID=UPI00128F0E4C|nr:hypothetical protein [Burkholderia sp. lig30]
MKVYAQPSPPAWVPFRVITDAVFIKLKAPAIRDLDHFINRFPLRRTLRTSGVPRAADGFPCGHWPFRCDTPVVRMPIWIGMRLA